MLTHRAVVYDYEYSTFPMEKTKMDADEKGHELDLNGAISRDTERKRSKKREHKETTLREYLKLVAKDPLIAQNSPSRLWEIIQDAGIKKVPEGERWFGVEEEYELFSELFGIPDVIRNVVNHIKVGASRGSTGKQLLVLVGPPAGGKSTIVRIIMRALEGYRKRPVFMIKDCSKWEDPLHLLPRYLREEAAKTVGECGECQSSEKSKHIHLGVKIEGDLCQVCRHPLETKYTEGDGTVKWWDVPVETFTFSMRGRRGIGSLDEPSDAKSSDVSVLTGRENIGITSVHGFKHPLAFELSGEIPTGERGIVEIREIFGYDPAVLRVLFSVAEEKELKVQGSNFPHLSVDTVIIGHANLTVFKKFSGNKDFEGLHDRFFVVPVRYPLRIKEEVMLYRKLIERESDFIKLRKCHIAPGTFELAATFAIMTRLMASSAGIDLLTKAKVYNGDRALTELQDREKKAISLQQLLEEGQASVDISKREGMFGVSSRTVLAALNTALAGKAEGNGCLTPLTAIQSLRSIFDHRMGFTPEDIERFRMFLEASDAHNVMSEYRESIVQAVTRAYLRSYGDLARQIFRDYIKEAKLYRNQKRKLIRGQVLTVERDQVTGKPREANIKSLRSVEEHIPWTEQEAETGRGEILELEAMMPSFGFDSYPPLARACEKKLMADSKATLKVVLAKDRPKGEEENRRYQDLWGTLLSSGYCDICATEAVERAGEFLDE